MSFFFFFWFVAWYVYVCVSVCMWVWVCTFCVGAVFGSPFSSTNCKYTHAVLVCVLTDQKERQQPNAMLERDPGVGYPTGDNHDRLLRLLRHCVCGMGRKGTLQVG